MHIRNLWVSQPRNYQEQTYQSPNQVIRFSHLERFRRMEDLCRSVEPRTFLDWGAGDGFLVKSLIQKDSNFADSFLAVYDPEPSMVELLKSTFKAREIRRVSIYQDLNLLRAELENENQKIDLIVCQEVLEHLPLLEREKFYQFCIHFLSSTGTCIVEVPVEFGPSILLKEFGRVFLKGREAEYTSSELIKSALGLLKKDLSRYDAQATGTWIHGHKGFDYRQLKQELKQNFLINQELASPIKLLPPFLGNQSVFFVLQKS